MMRRLMVGIGAALLTLGSLAAPAKVEAYPSACSVSVSGNRAAAACWGGSGRFRVIAYTWYGRAVGGPCMPVGYISTVYVEGLLRAGWGAC
jgi:hypothetical protein